MAHPDAQEMREILWKMYEDNRNQCRHHETQRSAVATLLLAVASGIVGLIKYDNLTVAQLPLTLLWIVLGIFGALFSAKQYERYLFHRERYREYLAALDSILPNIPVWSYGRNREVQSDQLQALKKLADKRHAKEGNLLSKARLNWFWYTTYASITLLGVVLSTMILGRT